MTVSFDPTTARFTMLDTTRESEIVAELDSACLDEQGQLRVMPAEFYARRRREDLALWCVRRGFYCLPTQELIDFLRQQIAGEKAIEIGAGHGAIGKALGIPVTDSRQQERPEIKKLYDDLGQAVVRYSDDIEKLTALEACEKYQPSVVIGAWVTHRYDPKRHKLGGNVNGIDEQRLIQKDYLWRYIFVGHKKVHEHKPILSSRHKTHDLPFLVSRSVEPLDVIWTWESRRRARPGPKV
jgi:hypothetical protein